MASVGANDHPRQREASREQDAVHKWGPRSWELNWGMCERKRRKLREQAPNIRDSAWDPEKIGQFVLIKKATEMPCNDSHTRVADSVGCTLDSDSLFRFKPAQPANLCFLLRWLLCSYLCSNEKRSSRCWMSFQWVYQGKVLLWTLRNQSELMKNSNRISPHFPHAHKVNILCSLSPSLALIKTRSNNPYFSLKFLVKLPSNITEQVQKTYQEILHSQLFILELRRKERKNSRQSFRFSSRNELLPPRVWPMSSSVCYTQPEKHSSHLIHKTIHPYLSKHPGEVPILNVLKT